MNRFLAFTLLIVSVVALSACGEKKDPTGTPGTQKLTLMLDFFPNADHTGIYLAKASGEFEKAGLDVDIQAPGDAASPLKLLETGKVDLAISYEPEVFLARDKGAKIQAIAALVQKPLTSIINVGTGKARLRSPADLENHSIGTAGIPYQDAYLKTILEKAGADPATIHNVNVGFNLVPALLSKKVYAILGGYWNYEGVQLERRKRNPAIIRVDEAGVPTYNELVIVARSDEVRHKAAVIRRFLQALARAHTALRSNPSRGIDALLQASPDLDRGLQEASLEKTLPLFFPENTERPWGWMEPRQWQAFGKWMLDNDLITQPPSAQALNDDLLPGQGF
jgi:putative hydroxymethylpyrimidine transport system substrate-binding protein